jgi:hypothetical protein
MCLALLAACGAAFAFQIPEESRLDRLAIPDPSLVTPHASLGLADVAEGSGMRVAWDRFRTDKAGGWRVVLDGRSGAPLLVEGSGMRWPVRASAEALPALESSLRAFLVENRDLLQADDAELVLDPEATAPLGPDTFQVVFSRAVGGVPVRGDRYVFVLGYGNLVAFGASRWTRIDANTLPTLSADLAADALAAYAGTRGEVELLAAPHLELIPLPAQGGLGAGYTSALVWQVVLSFPGERGTWLGLVDAHDGTVRAFFDDVRYAQVRGGVHPESGDGQCPSGCEQPNYPMPFARVTVDESLVLANDMGQFSCQPFGTTATTDLTSPTVRIADSCGPVSVTVTCDADLDLGSSTGSNCSVAPGSSPGNTKASRSCFYAVNRLKEHARSWISRTWLETTQTTVNTNVNSTCNATWGGNSLNMYRAGGACRNTCEAVGVAAHEWGHGMDQNDGGNFDNPSEAYGDISEFLTDHTSCVGRGFFVTGRCSGYGDTCLTCSGIRDMDWGARAANTPATPAGFLTQRCPGGGGPCGKEVHCEAYVAGETIWDLAVRDLPASGLDQATAWQVVDRLWYRSRPGSGGNMYTCALPNANGCAATSLFSRLRQADDDDGNLNNGTPHAAAIFAAFNRHGIACGLVGDASNQSTTVCPALQTPLVTVTGLQNQVQLNWSAVPGATSYRVLRNDVRCEYSYTAVATVAAPATSYVDTGLANDFQEFYRVQAVGANGNLACESAVSACTPATPHITGPYGLSGAHQQLLDACETAGAGGDGTWDAGEIVRLTVPISNAGSEPITNLQATISTNTPGVEMLDETASYPDIPVGGSASALAPYFTLRLPAAMACGTVLPFDVTMTGTGGSWSGFFSQRVGGTATVTSTPLDESFSAGIPATWTVVNSGFGVGPASTWTTANPGGRTFASPLVDPVAIVDSNFAGASHSQDEHLISPAMNLAGTTVVTLHFDHYFRWFDGHNNERGDVDVRSSATGNGWVNVLRLNGTDSANPEHRSINISTQAAGATGVQVRFRYYLGSNEWWWQVDNVRVEASGPICTMTACAPGPSATPVSALQASRASEDGTALDVTWGVEACGSADHEILYGSLANVASYGVEGSVCGIGSSGATSWTGAPAGDLWFVVVGSNDVGTEGSWGAGPGGAPRKGGDASGQCGNLFRDNVASCP